MSMQSFFLNLIFTYLVQEQYFAWNVNSHISFYRCYSEYSLCAYTAATSVNSFIKSQIASDFIIDKSANYFILLNRPGLRNDKNVNNSHCFHNNRQVMMTRIQFIKK